MPTPTTGAVPAIAVCIALLRWNPPVSAAAILGEAGIVGSVYLIAVCTFGFDKDVRANYAAYARRLLASTPFGRTTAMEAAS